MGIVDGNCRVEIYIHLLDLPMQEQLRKMQQNLYTYLPITYTWQYPSIHI